MEIQLQELIEQIKKDGVEAAEVQAEAILNSAKAEAEKIISDAQVRADKFLQDAKSENERMVKSSEDAIRQAGRNLLISFRESVAKELKAVVGESVSNVYSSDELAQLVANAVNYTGNDNKVTIELKDTPEGVRVAVSDNGCGIDTDDISRVWDKYYSAHERKRRETAGTGIGLSIVKNILLAHNAPYGVQSQKDVGSTFWFVLKNSADICD